MFNLADKARLQGSETASSPQGGGHAFFAAFAAEKAAQVARKVAAELPHGETRTRLELNAARASSRAASLRSQLNLPV